MYPYAKVDKYGFPDQKKQARPNCNAVLRWWKESSCFYISCFGFNMVVSKERSLFQMMGMGKIGQMAIVQLLLVVFPASLSTG